MASQSPYIGVDVGTRRIGLAKSDAAGRFAMPFETVDASNQHEAAVHIAELVEQEDCHTVVVGWPLTLEGGEGRAVRQVAGFVDKLDAALSELNMEPTIIRWDERLTTSAAESFLIGADVSRQRRRKVVDQIAATHILQGYLDSLDKPGEPDQ